MKNVIIITFIILSITGCAISENKPANPFSLTPQEQNKKPELEYEGEIITELELQAKIAHERQTLQALQAEVAKERQTLQTLQSQKNEQEAFTTIDQQPVLYSLHTTPTPTTTHPPSTIAATALTLEPFPSEKQGITVYITKTGGKYHRSGCRYLSKSQIPISLDVARRSYGACSVCSPL